MSSILDGTFKQDGGLIVSKQPDTGVFIPTQPPTSFDSFRMVRAPNGGWIVFNGEGFPPAGAFSDFDAAIQWLRKRVK